MTGDSSWARNGILWRPIKCSRIAARPFIHWPNRLTTSAFSPSRAVNSFISCLFHCSARSRNKVRIAFSSFSVVASRNPAPGGPAAINNPTVINVNGNQYA